MRLLRIIAKELKCVKEDISFNLVTILSPLLFLFAFWLMLSGGIMLPVQVYPDTQSSDFLKTMENYTAPDGTPYMELQPAAEAVPPTNAESNLIVIEQEPSLRNGAITGKIVHYLNDVNENMTKNFRNRLGGALVSYIDALRKGGNVLIAETTVYEQDIPWDTGFGVSVFVFGAVLAGLLFGMLSVTSEWENKTTKLLKLSPYPAGITVTGKLLANIIKCFVSGLIFLIIFFLISKTLPVHALPFITSLLLVYSTFVCIGMCVGIYIKSTLTAFLISLATALTLWVGGGGFGPLSYFGDIANVLGSINPATYAIEVVRWCYFNGNTNLVAGFTFLSLAFMAAFSLIIVIYTRWIRSEEVR
jgi:ABC-2 type transport system permease protein